MPSGSDRPVPDTKPAFAAGLAADPVPAASAGAVPGRRAAGQLEAAVLDALQQAGAALSPAEVRERVGTDLAYTTVVTIFTRLHAKGTLSRQKTGRVYRYAPVADEPGLAARRMARVLDSE